MFSSNHPHESLTGNYIVTFFRVFVLSALLVTAFQGSSHASRKYFDFVNHSGLRILSLYISQSGYNKWGPDLLDSSTILESGESVNLWYDTYYDKFDVKVVFTDSTPDAIFSGHSFSSLWRLTIYKKNGNFWITSN